MAVLHHAFRCPITPAAQAGIMDILDAWRRGDRKALSAMALDAYAALENRHDICAAFALDHAGPASSWMQPENVSPGLAALVILAPRFVRLPGLSHSHDSNHHLLETQLPLLGWTAGNITRLVHGEPIEIMFPQFDKSTGPIERGGFQSTGGWIPHHTAVSLQRRIEDMDRFQDASDDRGTLDLLSSRNALHDAQAMLGGVMEGDWLVSAITH